MVLEGRRSNQRVIGEERDLAIRQLLTEYEQGRSIRDLAARHRISIGLARNLLVQGGVQFRTRGGATRGPRKASR